jgi:hypothetical protein
MGKQKTKEINNKYSHTGVLKIFLKKAPEKKT